MATTIHPSLRSALERLKHAGSINGLCLGWRRQVMINLLPFEHFRAEQLVHAMQEAREHFGGGGHEVEVFWFGFDGVHVLVACHGECVLAVLHARSVEVDFIARAAGVFLKDSHLLIDAALHSHEDPVNDGESSDDRDEGSEVSRVLI